MTLQAAQAIGMMPPAQPARPWRCRQRCLGVIEAGHGAMVGCFLMVYDGLDGCHVLVFFFRMILSNGSKMRDQNLEIDISPGIWTDWHKELLILCVGLVPHYRAIPSWQTNCCLVFMSFSFYVWIWDCQRTPTKALVCEGDQISSETRIFMAKQNYFIPDTLDKTSKTFLETRWKTMNFPALEFEALQLTGAGTIPSIFSSGWWLMLRLVCDGALNCHSKLDKMWRHPDFDSVETSGMEGRMTSGIRGKISLYIYINT